MTTGVATRPPVAFDITLRFNSPLANDGRRATLYWGSRRHL